MHSNTALVATANVHTPVGQFNWQGIEQRAALETIAAEARDQIRMQIGSTIRLGGLCLRIQELLAKSDNSKKRFEDFAEKIIGVSGRTAYRYVRAYKSFARCATVSLFEDTALYELSGDDDVRKVARHKAELLSEKGVFITAAVARELLSETPTATKSPKADKATSFDPEALDATPARVIKQPKPGEPLVSRQRRAKAQKALGMLIRALDDVGLCEKYALTLSAMTEDLQRVGFF